MPCVDYREMQYARSWVFHEETSLAATFASSWLLPQEGGSHSLWMNPSTGALETVPRHTEIADKLARKICKGLGIPDIHESE